MCKVQMLRALVKQRLTAAAEEIFGLFERTIAEYEEELCRSKEENERQRKLLDAVFNPQLRLHRADVQQLLASKEEVPPDQRPALDQEVQTQPPVFKKQQEEEQLQGLEAADITEFTFTPAPVKSEGEEKPQSSQLHRRKTERIKTEADEEDCGGRPAPTRNSDPDTHLQPDTDEMTEDLFEPETGVCNDDKTTREAPFVLNCMKNYRYSSCEKSFPCVVCGKQFNKNSKMQIHMRTHTGEKPFSCSLCFKKFSQKSGLDYHLKTHTAEKPFSCSVCGKTFGQKAYLHKHMKCHTGVKPYSCPFCNKCFLRCEHLQSHMRTHTGEKPFRCSLCDKRFSWRCQLKTHKCVGKSSQLRGLWTRQEGEQLQGLQEAEITEFIITPVPVKSEDEEKPQSSQLHQKLTEQIKTEADYGGPEPARNSGSLESHGWTNWPIHGQFL